jgi:hypothetical protein
MLYVTQSAAYAKIRRSPPGPYCYAQRLRCHCATGMAPSRTEPTPPVVPTARCRWRAVGVRSPMVAATLGGEADSEFTGTGSDCIIDSVGLGRIIRRLTCVLSNRGRSLNFLVHHYLAVTLHSTVPLATAVWSQNALKRKTPSIPQLSTCPTSCRATSCFDRVNSYEPVAAADPQNIHACEHACGTACNPGSEHASPNCGARLSADVLLRELKTLHSSAS